MAANMKKRALSAVAVLCSLMILIGIMPTNLGTLQANADDDSIIVYFDTGGGEGDYGWKKDMSNVYYCLSDQTDSSGVSQELTFSDKMTLTNLKSLKDPKNGRIFQVELNASDVGRYIAFSPYPNGQKGYARTARRSEIKVADRLVVYISESTTEYNGYRHPWYTTMPKVVDYAGKTFKIANLTETSVEFTLKFTSDDGKSETSEDVTVSARNLGHVCTVPSVTDDATPYSKVTITRKSDGTKIKEYDLGGNKCLGKTLKYGITQYANSSSYVDDADGKTLSFYGEDYGTIPAVNKELYLAKDGFSSYGAASNIKVVVGDKEYDVEALTTGGNASYVTTEAVNVPANTIFSIKCQTTDGTDIYNLVWNNPDKNLCVLANGDAAEVSDTRTVQSTDNELNGQKYITVKSDFFDYQYDDYNNSQYTYQIYGESGKKTEQSKLANAKRPYLTINEALSASTYGNTSYPMYLGQFWLPLDDSGTYSTSENAYDSATALVQRAGNNSYFGTNQQYVETNQTYGFYTHFGFGNILRNFKWPANLAFRTTNQNSGTYMPFDAVAQGLVADELQDGKLMDPSKTSSIPYFDQSWWERSFTSSQGQTTDMKNYLKVYEELDFPFFEIPSEKIDFKDIDYDKTTKKLISDPSKSYNGNYYVFDSMKYSVKVNETDGKYSLEKHNEAYKNNDYSNMVYDNYGSEGKAEATSKGQQYGLFPFNSASEGGYNSSTLHYGFGIRYDIDFYLTETGTVDGNKNGTPITFTFQGDDDVWVFLDGKLLLDMGGAHKNAVGEINFNTRNTWISAIGQASSTSIVSNNKTDKNANDSVIKRNRSDVTESFNTDDWASRLTEGEHTITMFYMERGMLNSNLYCMFNLPTNVTSLQLQEDTDFGRVNDGFLDATKYVADSDIFNYAVANKGTTEVLGSGYENPIAGIVYRNNSDVSGKVSTLLLNNATVGTKTITTPSNRIYLDISDSNSYWSGGSYAAWLAASNGNRKYVPAQWDSYANMWYVEKDDNYNQSICWLRINPEYYNGILTEVHDPAYWDDFGFNDTSLWNNGKYWDISFSSFTGGNNTAKFTSYKGGDITKTSYSVEVPDTHTYNFNQNGTQDKGYVPLESTAGGVTYQMKDMFAFNDSNILLPVIYDTRTYNNTGNQNVVSLQYGELATLSKQFTAKTNMKVTQLNTLSAPVSSSRASGYNDSTQRTVSKYYDTYIKSAGNTDGLTMVPSAGIYNGNDVSGIALAHANTMYEKPDAYVLKDELANKNYSNNTVINLQYSTDDQNNFVTTYMLSDPEKASNTNVSLRQVFINAVKTADLKLTKYLTGVTDADKEFEFTITFTEVFGSSDSNAKSKIDVSQIKYYKNGATTASSFSSYNNTNKTVTFKLKANEYITIKGIPVGTKYQISEKEDTVYTLDKDNSQNFSSVATELVENVDINVFNKRKTGAIRLRKLLYQENGTTQVTDSSEEFEFVVTCKAPTEAGSIGGYPIKYHTAGDSDDLKSVQWTKDGDTYSIIIKLKPSTDSNQNNDVIIEGFPVDTTYEVLEKDNPSGFVQIDTDYKAGTGTGDQIKRVDQMYTSSSQDDKIDLVTIKNQISPIIMPSTGGDGSIYFFPIGLTAILLAGAGFVIYKKKFVTVNITESKGRYFRK